MEYLHGHYDKPRLIHREHVHLIIEAPLLKEGNGKELQPLCYTLSWHLHALTTRNPYGLFVMALMELKLDQAANFEWQRHSQNKPDVPHFNELQL